MRELFTAFCAILFIVSAFEAWKNRSLMGILGILLAGSLAAFIWTGHTAFAIGAVVFVLARIWVRRDPERARAIADRLYGPFARRPAGEAGPEGEAPGDPAATIEALERERSPRSIPAVERHLRHPDPRVRIAAFRALAAIGTPEAREALARSLEDEADGAARREALGAAFGAWGAGGLEEMLERIGAGERTEYLDRLIASGEEAAAEREVAARIAGNDPDPAVRAKAEELSRRIGGGEI